MHLVPSSKPQKAKPLVPIVSQWKVPFHRRMRGKRFNARGEFIGPSGPPKPVPDVAAIKAVKAAYAAAARKGLPQEGSGFDLGALKLTAGRILVARGRTIKEEGGIALPEAQWKHAPGWIVICVAPDVECCAAGDRVLFAAKHKVQPIDLGGVRLFLSRAGVVVGLIESRPL